MFVFKGISSDDMGVVAEEEDVFLARAAQRYEKIEIDGRNGAIFNEQGYTVVEKSIKLQILEVEKLDKILSWLNGVGELEYNGRITKARFYNQIDIERVATIKAADVAFTRDPFWTKKRDEYISIKDIVFNEGTIYSEPVIMLERDTTNKVDITINDVRFVYNFGSEKYVEIDCGKQTEQYEGLNRSRNVEIGYKYPTILPGVNRIVINSRKCKNKNKKKGQMAMIKIFNANDRIFNTNGNIAINPLKCKEIRKKSLNGWYIEVEVDIKYKDYIEQDKLCVIKAKSKANPQAFRIDSLRKNSIKVSFTANHVMFDAKDYFLTDVRLIDQNAQSALSYINSRTDKQNPFSVYSNVQGLNTAYFIRKNLLEAWETIEERWGGTFDADNWNISFLNVMGNDNGEVVSYGNNMQGIEIFEDWSNVVTKLYPVGYDGIMLPEVFLESDIQYEKPYTKPLDFKTTLEEEEKTKANLIKELRDNAKKYLEINQYPRVSYEVNSDINQNLEMGDIIHVKHPLVTIKTEVIMYEYNVIAERVQALSFGNYTRDVKSKFDNIKNSVKEITKKLSSQEIAIIEQTNLINTLNKQGYVYIDENEILILDKLPIDRAKNVWRFGLGGIGFSSNGYEGPFETAMTMDGRINADFITTGKLDASLITTGILKSSNYKSGSTGMSINLADGSIDTANFKVNANGEIIATGGIIGGFILSEETFEGKLNGIYDYNIYDLRAIQNIIMGNLTVRSTIKDVLDSNGDGEIHANDYAKIQNIFKGIQTNTKIISGDFKIDSKNPKNCISVSKNGEICVSIGVGGINANLVTTENIVCGYGASTEQSDFKGVAISGTTSEMKFISGTQTGTSITYSSVTSQSINNTSLAELKKHIEEVEDVCDIIKNSTIYKYNYKDEKDTEKKHIGFVIGEGYNTPDEVIASNNEAIDIYTAGSITWRFAQQILERVEKCEKALTKNLEGSE